MLVRVLRLMKEICGMFGMVFMVIRIVVEIVSVLGEVNICWLICWFMFLELEICVIMIVVVVDSSSDGSCVIRLLLMVSRV